MVSINSSKLGVILPRQMSGDNQSISLYKLASNLTPAVQF